MEVSGEDVQDPGEQEEDLPEGQEEEQCWGSRSGSAGSQDRRIRMFFGLPDPDPLVRGMDLDPAPEPGGVPLFL